MEFKSKKKIVNSAQNILVDGKNKDLKYTKELKDISSKKRKTLKTLFISLGIIITSGATTTGFVFLIDNAKKQGKK